jgi:hypothetical protein
MSDRLYNDIFFDPKPFVYPIVDAALRGLYVNGVPVFGPDGHANVICLIGDEAVGFIQHCLEDYDGEDDEQQPFLVRVCKDVAEYIHENIVLAIQLQQEQNAPDRKVLQKRRRDDDEDSDLDVYDPEDPQPPIDLAPAPRRSSRKAARQEDEEDNLPEEAPEDVVLVFGPSNPASIPFNKLNQHFYYDVANLAYDYNLAYDCNLERHASNCRPNLFLERAATTRPEPHSKNRVSELFPYRRPKQVPHF